jgi:hypothetical protein
MRDVQSVDLGLSGACEQVDVSDPAALVQMIGWLKATGDGNVLFRGQAGLHGASLTPSGLRGAAGRAVGAKGIFTHDVAIRDYLAGIWGSECGCVEVRHSFADGHLCDERVTVADGNLMRGLRRPILEPLLQHYGLRTRWIDLVDNVWIALWFACHEYVSADAGRFAYLRPRKVEPTSSAYLLVVDLAGLASTDIPGYWLSPTARLVDLRYAAPSTYLRPHAQHGLLAAARGPLTPAGMATLSGTLKAVIRIQLSEAMEWLGAGRMLSTYTLFPPAVRDEGYRRLLRYATVPPPTLGALTSIGPG